jgi:hypothetical protein
MSRSGRSRHIRVRRRLWRRIARFVVAIAAAAIFAFRWAASHETDFDDVVACVLAAVALYASFSSVRDAAWRSRLLRARDPASAVMGAAYLRLTELGIPPEAIGLTVHVPRKSMSLKSWTELQPVARLRLGAPPPASQIRWTKGKGVLGLAWQSGNLVVMNTKEVFDGYAALGRQAWNAAPKSARLNLSHKEMLRIRDSYSSVASVPVLDKGTRFQGCLTLDLSRNCDFAFLLKPETQAVVRVAASTLAGKLA